MKRLFLLFVACGLSFWLPMATANEALPTENDPVAQKRAVELAAKLRCLVCQNQSIAESNAELAVDLRRQVREQITAGKTDQEIITFMTDRYGDFVLYQPPMKGTTVLLWLGPLILLLLGLLGMYFFLRKQAGKGEEMPAPLTDAERARVAFLLKQRDDSKT
ncbi:MAG: cytochrome c-type biogenesis protein CcmH [Burkholderiales bacterium]|jgi:cytochrome c-type biogenesis protein CcmH|nr:cytochrome c-type biogenesis protein CcmH [Burkholderiales bacterium]